MVQKRVEPIQVARCVNLACHRVFEVEDLQAPLPPHRQPDVQECPYSGPGTVVTSRD